MGRTFVTATINGPSASKEYSFLVDPGSAYFGLPVGEIEELGLRPVGDGSLQFMTATGMVELETYGAEGEIQGRGFISTVVPTPVPLIGYELLENRRFKVNPVTQEIEPVPTDEIGPPYLLDIVPCQAESADG